MTGIIISDRCAVRMSKSKMYISLLAKMDGITLPQTTNFRLFQTFADDSLKFDENESQLFKKAENTMEKGEIARYEQFLLFPQCFQKTCTTDT